MAPEKKPPALGCAGDFGMVQLAGVNCSEINRSHIENQAFRAAWLARRARISITLAATLAPLAFGTGAAS